MSSREDQNPHVDTTDSVSAAGSIIAEIVGSKPLGEFGFLESKMGLKESERLDLLSSDILPSGYLIYVFARLQSSPYVLLLTTVDHWNWTGSWLRVC
jgi:hypothetical protein